MRSRIGGIGLICFILFLGKAAAQDWVSINPQSIPPTGQRDIVPTQCQTYWVNNQELLQVLASAPQEYVQDPATSNTLLFVGMADGTADIFRIVRYDMMEAGLAAQFVHIKTYRGVSISHPYRTLRADWTNEGFRAVIRDLDGTTYIDPYQRNDQEHRIAYYKDNLFRNNAWDCGVVADQIINDPVSKNRVFGDCQFRTFRLAQTVTGEYSNFFGATSPAQAALVLSQVVTAINRVNEVYETDFTTRLILISNTTSLFYYDPGGDPFTGTDACAQLSQNQTNTDAIIGNANYDIGHVFAVGSGGCASLNSVCFTGAKAQGATGLNPPTGDPFYIDYVAHEMGHQFGGDHTFNGTVGSCGGGNRAASSAYEPGSGTTIMAYAGICGAQDVQPHSDPYFHARSLDQITYELSITSCANFITLNNTAPVAGNTPNYTIPISTPFVLTASASDPENDPMSYCWEQYDLEGTSTDPPTSNDGDGPMFRSFIPSSSPSRYFPRLADQVANVSPVWEVLPSVARTMNFKVTVRDYHNLAGCTDEDDVTLTVSAAAGPFIVTSQGVPTVWQEGSVQTITWNVANTTAAPINCGFVDIRLSLDGGFTYPTVLAFSETNDGSATISVPAGTTTTGRIMVRSSNNIFYDINNANITITAGLPNFSISLNPNPLVECNDGSVQTTITIGQTMGFSDPVTLSVLNLPPGATAMLNPSVVSPGGTSILTINNLTGLFGTYNPTVHGTSTLGSKDMVFSLTLLDPPPSATTLVSPANNATAVVITPTLDWSAVGGITQYEYQIAYDNAFASIAYTNIVSIDKAQLYSPLLANQIYYWRVRCINSCGPGAWSSVFHFTTSSCFSLNSANVPLFIPADATPTVLSSFYNPIEMTINDVDVINLTGVHTYVDDLKFSLISPNNTERLIWNQPCTSQDNFNINFDDEAANSNWPCPPTNGLTYKPSSTLTVFDGLQAKGTWMMKVQDVAYTDGGAMNTWGLKVCGTINCQLTVNQTSGVAIGSLPAAITCATSGDTIWISSQLAGQTINIGANPITITKHLVLIAQGGAVVNITSGGTRVFDINNGIQFECNGLTITAGTALTGGAISNSGTLRLKNATIEKNVGINGATLIQNNPGGTLNVQGSCYINQ